MNFHHGPSFQNLIDNTLSVDKGITEFGVSTSVANNSNNGYLIEVFQIDKIIIWLAQISLIKKKKTELFELSIIYLIDNRW